MAKREIKNNEWRLFWFWFIIWFL